MIVFSNSSSNTVHGMRVQQPITFIYNRFGLYYLVTTDKLWTFETIHVQRIAYNASPQVSASPS